MKINTKEVIDQVENKAELSFQERYSDIDVEQDEDDIKFIKSVYIDAYTIGYLEHAIEIAKRNLVL